MPASEKQAVVDYFQRINDDYHRRARNTEYHDGEVKYDYLRLNCAKTIGSAFRYGAGYKDLDVTSPRILAGRRVVAAANANVPTEMALKLLREWNARGYGLDVVLYRKYPNSTYVDPHEEEKVMFRDLPDRFPSVLSRDFRRDQGQYEDPDNLFALYLLYNLGRYRVRIDEQTLRLELTEPKAPLPYAEAERLAAEAALFDSDQYGSQLEVHSEAAPGSGKTRRRAAAGPEAGPKGEAPVGDGRLLDTAASRSCAAVRRRTAAGRDSDTRRSATPCSPRARSARR